MTTDRKEYQREWWRAKNADPEARAAYNAYQREYQAKRKLDPEYRARYNERQREKLRRLRREVIDGYGGKCECCGEDRWQFLTLEHKNGGGTLHRQEISGQGIYRDARRRSYPPEYGLLCWNCNAASGIYGVCPHNA